MDYSIFSKLPNDATKEPMFFGNPINVARYDKQHYEVFEKLTEKQISFFWRPEEVDLSRDRIDFRQKLSDAERHIFTSNLKYQCLVAGTEVLTQNGWIDLIAYNGKEPILIYDLETEQTKWEIPSHKFTKPHSGIVYEFKANVKSQFIQTVTPDHRMPYIARKSNAKYFVSAENLQYSNTKQAPIVGEFIEKGVDYLTPIERLIIATQADGSVYDRYSGALSGRVPIYFSFSKKRKIKRLHEIADACGFEIEQIGTRKHKSKFAKDTIAFKVFVPIEFKPHDWKLLNQPFDLKDKSASWCRDFIEEVVLWDGSTPKDINTANYYCTTVKENADFVQAVAVLAGYSPRITTRPDNRKAHFKDLHVIRFICKRLKNGESINKTAIEYNGNVSCVTVSTGAFVIRYKDTVSVTGNCLLDSVQGRSPSIAFLPLTSLPELEVFIDAWVFFESIHSRSYTHIIRNVYDNPSEVLDDIIVNEAIMKRADAIGKYYDDLIEIAMRYNLGEPVNKHELKQKLLLCMVCVNVLEAIRFYISFACSFAFAERELMEGNAKIIRLIARDEACHLSATQTVIGLWRTGKDDPEMAELWTECQDEIIGIFQTAVEQEKEWADYLFKDGSMLGLNKAILTQYIEYITNVRMNALGLPILFPDVKSNPISWINAWTSSDNVQVAPQETEMSSYLIGQVDAEIQQDDLAGFDL